MQRLLPPHLFATCAALAGVVGWFVPLSGRAPWQARIVGAPIMLAGLVLTVRGANEFGRLDTNIKTFNDPEKLVATGPFQFTRNPMYLGFGVTLIGISLLVGSVTAVVGPAVFWLASERWYIPFEERRMATTFGASYAEYSARVPSWLGRVRSVPDSES